MTKTLEIAPGLALPLDAATRRMAILAMSGAGKSNTAVVLAEAMFDAGIPWVAIDPKGDWWGIRSSKSGKGPGLPIPIFGGSQGDVPLEPGAGNLIAEMIYEQRLTCVLDVSDFEVRQEFWGFLADFGNTLFHLHRRKPRALHLFLEEADEYIPQKTAEKGNLPKCLGVWQRVVKKGRTGGLGSTQITQRNASLNKDTLYQAELLIAMRVTGKADREAVRGWVEHHNAGAEIVDSLPTLGDGDGWVTSPAWLRETKKVHFHRRRTFDSGSTPILLQGDAPPATLADVDLETLRAKMAATIEKAKADDPGLLRGRIVKLERELAAAKKVPAVRIEPRVETKTERVVIPMLTEQHLADLKDIAKRIQETFSAARGVAEKMVEVRGELSSALHRIDVAIAQATKPGKVNQAARAAAAMATVIRTTTSRRLQTTAPAASIEGQLPKGETAVLRAVAHYPEGCSRKQLTVLTGYRRSTRDTYLQRLSEKGLVQVAGTSALATQAGLDALGPDFEPPPIGAELLEHWRRRLPEGERKILDIVVAAHPDPVDRDSISEATGYARSSRDTYLQRLGAKRLVELERGSVKASELLFDGAA